MTDRSTDHGLHTVADMPGEDRYGACSPECGCEDSEIRIGGMVVTREEAQAAGLLPEQRAARRAATAAALEAIGATEGPHAAFYQAMRND